MSLKRNVIASYIGQAWAAVMGIAFMPLYLRVLGTESFGLIGVYTILQGGMILLDFGLTPTLTREMARSRVGTHTPDSIRSLLRSMEFIFCAVAFSILVLVWLGAPWLAHTWIKSDRLTDGVVVQSLRIMGFVLATRWLEQIYRGVLQGLQDTVWWNATNAILATIRWAGAYLVIVLVSSNVLSFFAWQGAISLLAVATLAQRAYRILPVGSQRARFDPAILRKIRAFAGGMFVSALLNFCLAQSDKIIISKLLSLEQLGFYTLASSVAAGLLLLAVPMTTAVYPQMTDLATRNDVDALSNIYLGSCEWMAAIIIPPALLLTFFPDAALFLWTGNSLIANSVAPILSLLMLGTLCNGLMNLPYMLQLAYGWTSLAIFVNLGAAAIAVPTLLLIIPRYGVVGAASVWLLLNFSYILILVPLMHRRILPGLKLRWYRDAVVRPVAAGVLAALALRFLLPTSDSRLSAGIVVFISAIVIVGCVFAVLPNPRQALWKGTLGIVRAITDHMGYSRSR